MAAKETVTTAEAKIGPRNFRATPDIENFYRFVHDNDLRREAHWLMDKIHASIAKTKKRKSKAKSKSKARAKKLQ